MLLCTHVFARWAVTILTALLLLMTPVLVVGRVEAKNTQNYQSVKEDFLCRACVSLGEVFFEELLTPIAGRYRGTVQATDASPSSSSSTSAPSSRHTSQVGHRQREQMIVEVHEAIDALCSHLETSIQRQTMAAADVGAEDAVARQLLSPLVTSTDIRDGVVIACPTALEEINEALTDTAFHHLLSGEKASRASASATHVGGSGDASTAAPSASSAPSGEAVPYELPAAGAFCEKAGLCSSFVHYHITSDTAVRRRALEGHEAAATTAAAAAGGSPTPKKTTSKRTSTKTSRSNTGKRGAAAKAATGRYVVEGVEEDETFAQTLRRVFERRTWQQLVDVLNVTELLTLTYWVDGVRLMMDPNVYFHLQAYVPVMAAYALGLVILLVVVVVAVVVACPRKSRGNSSSGGSAVPSQQQQREGGKKEQ